eukprot:gene19914-12865_t
MGQKWTSLPDMPEARYNHAMAATPDGEKVVYAGGLDANGTGDGTKLKSVVMFEFSTQAWTSLPDMPEERHGHTMAATPDGKKLVCAGGADANDTPIKSVVMFDFSTHAWTPLPNMPENRAQHTMAATPDGKKLVCAGGHGGSSTLKSVVMFDFSTQAWTSLPDMPEERYGKYSSIQEREFHTMAATLDGKLVCAGGTTESGNKLNFKSVVMFEFSTQAWTPLPDMPEERWAHTMAASPDGKKLVCAGGLDANDTPIKSVVMFDFSTQAWTSLPDMPEERVLHTMAATPDGKLVCAGGQMGGFDGPKLKSVVVFDFKAAALDAARPALPDWTVEYSDTDCKVFYSRATKANHPKVTMSTFAEMEGIVKKEAAAAAKAAALDAARPARPGWTVAYSDKYGEVLYSAKDHQYQCEFEDMERVFKEKALDAARPALPTWKAEYSDKDGKVFYRPSIFDDSVLRYQRVKELFKDTSSKFDRYAMSTYAEMEGIVKAMAAIATAPPPPPGWHADFDAERSLVFYKRVLYKNFKERTEATAWSRAEIVAIEKGEAAEEAKAKAAQAQSSRNQMIAILFAIAVAVAAFLFGGLGE